MTQPLTTDEIPDDIESGAYFILKHDKEGKKALAAELKQTVELGDTPRELLDMIAAELKVSARRPDVAAVVEKYVNQCPSGMDLKFCDYMVPPYTDDPRANEANIAAWRRRQGRVVSKWVTQRDRLLKLVDSDLD